MIRKIIEIAAAILGIPIATLGALITGLGQALWALGMSIIYAPHGRRFRSRCKVCKNSELECQTCGCGQFDVD